MTRNFIIISFLLLFILTGCEYPSRQVRTLDDKPGVYIIDPPSNTILYVDGLKVGHAADFDGQPNILVLEPGTHHVEIHKGDDVIHSSDIFLGEGTRREIKLSGGNR